MVIKDGENKTGCNMNNMNNEEPSACQPLCWALIVHITSHPVHTILYHHLDPHLH